MPPEQLDQTTGVLHAVQRRVTLRNTDAAGLIHYAVALEWTEALFTDWLMAIGHPIGTMLTSGEATPIVRAEAEFHAPVGVDDILDFELSLVHLGNKSFSVRNRARMASTEAIAIEVRAYHVFALLGKESSKTTTASAPVPEWLRQALTAAGCPSG